MLSWLPNSDPSHYDQYKLKPIYALMHTYVERILNMKNVGVVYTLLSIWIIINVNQFINKGNNVDDIMCDTSSSVLDTRHTINPAGSEVTTDQMNMLCQKWRNKQTTATIFVE